MLLALKHTDVFPGGQETQTAPAWQMHSSERTWTKGAAWRLNSVQCDPPTQHLPLMVIGSLWVTPSPGCQAPGLAQVSEYPLTQMPVFDPACPLWPGILLTGWGCGIWRFPPPSLQWEAEPPALVSHVSSAGCSVQWEGPTTTALSATKMKRSALAADWQ